jgi:serine/threonine protein kinase/WD40 repeat protein
LKPHFDKERWLALMPHLDELLELSRDDRQARLAVLQQTDAQLAADVAALIQEHEALDRRRFLEDSVWPSVVGRDGPGTVFGPYRLKQLLGEGGMGVVWLAEQNHPIRRTVAVKVVKPGHGSRDVLSRFESERQALALLSHGHIAKVFDAGVTDDGRPYFVMEHVAGDPITAFAENHRLTIRQRLELLLQVCDGVQHAHQNGVLHRDLKPGNILVTEESGQPVSKVIDFGVAKATANRLTDHTLHTEFGVLVGTPEYMSPEQAGLLDAAVDTRTDIYSLGLVLYELLVGEPPFDRQDLRRRSVLEALRVIREEDPPSLTTKLRAMGSAGAAAVALARQTDPPSHLRQLRGDLEWIASRALEKNPADRYASVAELRADIQRHLENEPVLAGPRSTLYRLRKLASRHRAAAAALAVVVVAITASAVVSTISLILARNSEDQTRRQFIGTLVAQGMQRVDADDPLTGLLYLARALELEGDRARVRSHRIRLGEVLQRTPTLVDLWRHDAEITMLALSPRGQVATGSIDGVVKIRELSTGAERSFQLKGEVLSGSFSHDGAFLVVGSVEGRVGIWRASDLQLLREFTEAQRIIDLAVAPDAGLVAVALEDGAVRLLDVASGTSRSDVQPDGPTQRVVFSSSGALLATGGHNGVRVWEVRSGQPSGPLLPHSGAADVAFSRDGELVATAGMTGPSSSVARLWNHRDGRQLGEPMRHGAAVSNVIFADDVRLLVTTGFDHSTRVWRVPEGTPVGSPRISDGIARKPDVSSQLVIATPTQAGHVDLWSMGGERAGPALPHGGLALVEFDPSGRFLVSATTSGVARVWDLAPTATLPPRIQIDDYDFSWRVVESPDGSSLAVSSGGSPERATTRVFDGNTGMPVTPSMRCQSVDNSIVFSPDGRRLLTACRSGEIRLWDARTGEPLSAAIREEVEVSFAGFSPDGDLFVVGGRMLSGTSGAVRVRDANDGSARTPLLSHDGEIAQAWFSPDGRRLLTVGGGADDVRVWEVATGRQLWAAHHNPGVAVARWTATGAGILTGGFDQRVRFWNAYSGEVVQPALTMFGALSSLGLSPDGGRLVAGTAGGDARLVRMAPVVDPVSVLPHKGFIYKGLFSSDGALVLTASGDRTARLWDGFSGEALTPRLRAGEISRGAAFFNQGRSWAWTGTGVFVDDLTIDDRPVAELRDLAEILANRRLSETGAEIVMTGEDVEARYLKMRQIRSGLPDAPADYLRARAHAAWRRNQFHAVATILKPLQAQNDLTGADLMRLLGAFAASNLWRDALDELARQRSRWHQEPELYYMEAVALARLGETGALARHCRAALDATRSTRHPENAYWATRACLVQTSLLESDRADVAARRELAYSQMFGTLGGTQMEGAMLLRTGRFSEAFDRLAAAEPSQSPLRLPALLTAAAAARAGLRADARQWLSRAEAIPKPVGYRFMTAWTEAEGEGVREEVLRLIRPASESKRH